MSLEAALAANTDALNRVAALLQGASITPNVAAPVIQQPVQNFAPPAAPTTPPMGMPNAPFPGAGTPTPSGLPPRPFNDALGLLEWAKAKYGQFGAQPGYADKFGAILQQHGLHEVGIGAAQPHQLDSMYQAIAALG